MAVGLSIINYLLPIFAFLFVFIVVYALLIKTGVLGENQFVAIFISLILASFFIVNVQLVNFVEFTSSWSVVMIVLVFFALILLAFVGGKDGLKFLQKTWVGWVILGLIIVFFIISSSFVFNWAVNWEMVNDWFYTDWFGFILLILLGVVVSWVLAKSK